MNLKEILDDTLLSLNAEGLKGRIRILWNDRFTSRMGDAKYDKVNNIGTIRLSTPLFQRATENDCVETVIHEICHVVAHWKYGTCQGHNHNWHHLMRIAGYPNANRCHKVEREDLKQKRKPHKPQPKFRLKCGCETGVVVGKTVARRIVQKTQTYTCRRCRQQIHV